MFYSSIRSILNAPETQAMSTTMRIEPSVRQTLGQVQERLDQLRSKLLAIPPSNLPGEGFFELADEYQDLLDQRDELRKRMS
jgi:hypothetical protein